VSRVGHALSVVAALLPACQGADAPSTASADAGIADGSSMNRALTLQLVAEKKLSKLLPTKDVDHYEASGIAAFGGMLYVASDNLTKIAAIDTSLNKGQLGPGAATDSQYEAITASDDDRFFVMVEGASDADGRAEVAELGADTAFLSQSETDATFAHANKGFEGAAWLRVSGKEYLLALCENNNCKNDDSPPGEGRAQLLALVDGVWTKQASLKLPEAAAFLNYSDLALRSNDDGTYAAAIVSHKSSALWLGTLSTSGWAFTGASTFYAFPRTAEGAVRYCSVEGVTFLGPNVLAVVSDKSDGSEPCSDEEESIHIFQMPH
jgi:hypothetical protein